eukprot:GHVN01038214.1.p1 GENE.GHVN01038214.1~~GHVN01038214.1.p1  ORF type:complete len:116 (+),score=6.23 GHVN01038214.1:43-390(+)
MRFLPMVGDRRECTGHKFACGQPRLNSRLPGIPDTKTVLEDGDIINIDVTVFTRGVHGDCSETYIVGTGHDHDTLRLVKFAHDAMLVGITAVKPGKRLVDSIVLDLERVLSGSRR